VLSFAVLALAVYVPLWWFTWDWAPAQWFLVASAAMLLPRALAVPVAAASIVGTLGVSATAIIREDGAREAVLYTAYLGAVLVMGAVALYASARLVGVIDELHGNRAALARVAVNRERLRISRTSMTSSGRACRRCPSRVTSPSACSRPMSRLPARRSRA